MTAPHAKGMFNLPNPKEEVLVMPIIKIGMWPGRTHGQKAELARAVTEAVVTIAHTTPDQTIVIFEDIPRENWAVGGVLASDQQR